MSITLRERNLALSMALVHDNLRASPDELRRAVNDLGDEVRALRQRHETAVERAARFCYLEGWNDVAHERGADFNRAWAAWLASEAKAALEEGEHE